MVYLPPWLFFSICPRDREIWKAGGQLIQVGSDDEACSPSDSLEAWQSKEWTAISQPKAQGDPLCPADPSGSYKITRKNRKHEGTFKNYGEFGVRPKAIIAKIAKLHNIRNDIRPPGALLCRLQAGPVHAVAKGVERGSLPTMPVPLQPRGESWRIATGLRGKTHQENYCKETACLVSFAYARLRRESRKNQGMPWTKLRTMTACPQDLPRQPARSRTGSALEPKGWTRRP